MKKILKRIEGMTSGEAVIFGVWKGFIWSAELFAIVVLAAILDSFVPHAPCAPHAFMAIQIGFAVTIIDLFQNSPTSVTLWS